MYVLYNSARWKLVVKWSEHEELLVTSISEHLYKKKCFHRTWCTVQQSSPALMPPQGKWDHDGGRLRPKQPYVVVVTLNLSNSRLLPLACCWTQEIFNYNLNQWFLFNRQQGHIAQFLLPRGRSEVSAAAAAAFGQLWADAAKMYCEAELRGTVVELKKKKNYKI